MKIDCFALDRTSALGWFLNLWDLLYRILVEDSLFSHARKNIDYRVGGFGHPRL